MEKKMTKKNYFEKLLTFEEVLTDDEMIKFIKHEIELLNKKNTSKNGKQTATQAMNESIKQTILDSMEEDTGYTVSDIMKNTPEIEWKSNQQATALVRQLVEEEKVIRTMDKRRAVFTKVIGS